jgi:hypothetical protein
MKTNTLNKLIVDMPAGVACELRAVARLQTATGAGSTKGSLAERWMR